jgi:hypothetical protein
MLEIATRFAKDESGATAIPDRSWDFRSNHHGGEFAGVPVEDYFYKDLVAARHRGPVNHSPVTPGAPIPQVWPVATF